jgi:hypothetical protein
MVVVVVGQQDQVQMGQGRQVRLFCKSSRTGEGHRRGPVAEDRIDEQILAAHLEQQGRVSQPGYIDFIRFRGARNIQRLQRQDGLGFCALLGTVHIFPQPGQHIFRRVEKAPVPVVDRPGGIVRLPGRRGAAAENRVQGQKEPDRQGDAGTEGKKKHEKPHRLA